MAHISTYRIEQRVLAKFLEEGGGRYVALTHGAALSFRRRCYDLRNILRKRNDERNGEATSPYDDMQFHIPRKGEPDDNVLTVTLHTSLPKGSFETLDGTPMIIPTGEPSTAKPPNILDISDDDFEAIRQEAAGLFDED